MYVCMYVCMPLCVQDLKFMRAISDIRSCNFDLQLINNHQEANVPDGLDRQYVPLTFCVHVKFRSADLTLVLRADSEEDKLQWMIKLAQAIAIAKNFAQYSKVSLLGEGGQVCSTYIHTYSHTYTMHYIMYRIV